MILVQFILGTGIRQPLEILEFEMHDAPYGNDVASEEVLNLCKQKLIRHLMEMDQRLIFYRYCL